MIFKNEVRPLLSLAQRLKYVFAFALALAEIIYFMFKQIFFV